MSIPEQFTGYAAMNEKDGKALELKEWSYTPKKWNEDDVDIKIECTSICGSCIHTLRNEWPKPTPYPLIAGHEIVGTVVKAGSNSGHKVGSRVGVGAQGGSCRKCNNCKAGHENWCEAGMIGTYGGKWEDGSVAQGGYANYVRTKGHFAVEIPEGLSSDNAAPLMCAGITTYAPLVDNGAGPGKTVGIVGIGGLGHLALQFSLALGADTYAISHSDSKLKDAEALGLKDDDHFIVAKDIEATAEKWSGKFDLLIVTANGPSPPLDTLYFKLLKFGGVVNLCGLPEGKLDGFYGQALVGKGIKFGGSIIGPPGQIKEMLEFSKKHNIKSWTNPMKMSEATKGAQDMHAGHARYRILLKN